MAQAQPSGLPCDLGANFDGLTFGEECLDADTQALVFNSQSPRSFEGLGAFKSVEFLSVSEFWGGRDLTGISALTTLTDVYIGSLNATLYDGFHELSDLPNLDTLRLQSIGENDLSVMGEMPALRSLTIGHPSDLRRTFFYSEFTLPAMPSLEYLELYRGFIANPEVLENFTSLDRFQVKLDTPEQVRLAAELPRVTYASIDVGGRYSAAILDALHEFDSAVDLYLHTFFGDRFDVANIHRMAGLEGVISVEITVDSPPSNLTAFDGTRLRSFLLSHRGGGSAPLSVAPLARHQDLRRLSLSNFDIRDLSELQGLPSFEHLSLSGGRLNDVSDISGLEALETLSLRQMDWDTSNVWHGLENLRSLSLVSEGSLNLDILPPTLDLQNLTLEAYGIEDLSPLSGIAARYVTIEVEGVQDISGIENLRDLERLSVIFSEAIDLKSLLGLDDSVIVTLPYEFPSGSEGPFGTFRAEIEALP